MHKQRRSPVSHLQNISLWNEYFWQVDLELRELSPGQLSLVKRYETFVGTYANNQDLSEQRQAVATLLHHLLTHHHCVSSVAIVKSIYWDHHQLICGALCNSLSLTELKVYSLPPTPSQRSIATALLHLSHLRELEFQEVTFRRSFIDSLSEFLASTRSLTTLTMAHQRFICEEDAVAFVKALRQNQSITTLSLDITQIEDDPLDRWLEMPVSHRYAVILADYLCGNKRLRTLSMRGNYLEPFAVVARPVVMALLKNDTLTNLSLVRLPLEDEDIELITWLLSHKRTLKSLKMIRCDIRGVSSRVFSNLAALADNNTLEALTLDLSRFNTSECLSLFKALGSSTSVKKVTFERFNHSEDIFCALRESGVQESFFIGTLCALHESVDAFTECKGPSSVIVMSESFDRFELLLITLSLLPSCGHVTSMCLVLRLEHLTDRASSLIAQCISGMTALRKLELSTSVLGIADAFNKARRELAHALSANKSIRRLRLYGPWFGETETEVLANTLQSSRTLCELHFCPYDDEYVTSLMRKLATIFSSNYSLLSLRVDPSWNVGGDWFTVADVIRRNCSLVMRASHFVMGMRLKYFAAAAELVHWNPGVVEKVQELASVDENEAASRIKSSINSFSELNDFMRLAGVVRYGVTCPSRDDGKKQLVDIGQDCWLCIREYLKVGDILDEQ